MHAREFLAHVNVPQGLDSSVLTTISMQPAFWCNQLTVSLVSTADALACCPDCTDIPDNGVGGHLWDIA